MAARERPWVFLRYWPCQKKYASFSSSRRRAAHNARGRLAMKSSMAHKFSAGHLAGKISRIVKKSTRVTSETLAWGYLIEAIAGAVALLLAAYWIFFRK